jgi:hypothetical protein
VAESLHQFVRCSPSALGGDALVEDDGEEKAERIGDD